MRTSGGPESLPDRFQDTVDLGNNVGVRLRDPVADLQPHLEPHLDVGPSFDVQEPGHGVAKILQLRGFKLRLGGTNIGRSGSTSPAGTTGACGRLCGRHLDPNRLGGHEVARP